MPLAGPGSTFRVCGVTLRRVAVTIGLYSARLPREGATLLVGNPGLEPGTLQLYPTELIPRASDLAAFPATLFLLTARHWEHLVSRKIYGGRGGIRTRVNRLMRPGWNRSSHPVKLPRPCCCHEGSQPSTHGRGSRRWFTQRLPSHPPACPPDWQASPSGCRKSRRKQWPCFRWPHARRSRKRPRRSYS